VLEGTSHGEKPVVFGEKFDSKIIEQEAKQLPAKYSPQSET
jgi:hypothetical protein